MRVALFAFGLLAAGCTDLPTSGGAPTAGNAPIGAQQALFSEYPAQLFNAAAAVCDEPGQTMVQPNANEVRCESLPDPESAAALILQYNGTVEDLPKFIIAFLGGPSAQGYVVTADSYIRVPQRSGGTQQIRFNDDQVAEDLNSHPKQVRYQAAPRPEPRPVLRANGSVEKT